MYTLLTVLLDAFLDNLHKNSIRKDDNCKRDLNKDHDNNEEIEAKYAALVNSNCDEDVQLGLWRSNYEVINRNQHLSQQMNAVDSTLIRPPPPFKRNKHNGVRIRKHTIPEEVFESLKGFEPESKFECLSEPLTIENYGQKFHYLLYFEEASIALDKRRMDLDQRTLSKRGEFMSLSVPYNFIPLLEVGNKVLLTHPTRTPRLSFQGTICKIVDCYILMRFNDTFHEYYDGTAYNVTFDYAHMNFNFCHYAIDNLLQNICQFRGFNPRSSDVIFPKERRSVALSTEVVTNQVKWFQNGLTKRQKHVVFAVLRKTCLPSPYIVCGDAQTAITATVIECILQVVKSNATARILVCTASNSLADSIALYLIKHGLQSDTLVRLVSHRYEKKITGELKTFCGVPNNDQKNCDWLNRRVIVTTIFTAGYIYYLINWKTCFSHCFILESTRLTEPETIIPIGLTNFNRGLIVLCGNPDHNPSCFSKPAYNCGLSLPLMSRLIQSKPYAYDGLFKSYGGLNPFFISKLDNFAEESIEDENQS